MSTLINWVTPNELADLKRGRYLQSALVNNIIFNADIDLSTVILLLTDETGLTELYEKEFYLYVEKVHNYWKNQFKIEERKLKHKYDLIDMENDDIIVKKIIRESAVQRIIDELRRKGISDNALEKLNYYLRNQNISRKAKGKAFNDFRWDKVNEETINEILINLKKIDDNYIRELKKLENEFNKEFKKGKIKFKSVIFPYSNNLTEAIVLFDKLVKDNSDSLNTFMIIRNDLGEEIKMLTYYLMVELKIKEYPISYEEKIVRTNIYDKELKGEIAKFPYYFFIDINHQIDIQNGPINFEKVLTKDLKLNRIKEIAEKYSNTDLSLLLLGESGTGKELFAEAIHKSSKRKGKFVAINCASIPIEMLESELFGFEKGSFTSANFRKIGLLEEANDGTAFLDEIGEMKPYLQAKLLRAIDNKVIRRIGGLKDIKINVRFIYATHKNLYQEVKKGEFREDLYYRINELEIIIPPLRDRVKEDIELIIDKILDEYYELKKYEIEDSAKELLFEYDWPGNVRQLKAVIKRALLVSNLLKKNIDREIIETSIGKEAMQEFRKMSEMKIHTDEFSKSNQIEISNKLDVYENKYVNKALLQKGLNLKELLYTIEKEYILGALNMDSSQITAGKRLGYSQQKISKKILKFNIQKKLS